MPGVRESQDPSWQLRFRPIEVSGTQGPSLGIRPGKLTSSDFARDLTRLQRTTRPTHFDSKTMAVGMVSRLLGTVFDGRGPPWSFRRSTYST